MLRAISDRDRWMHAFGNGLRLGGLASFFLLMLILNSDVVASLVRNEEPVVVDRQLHLTEIGFENGYFRQIVEPEDGGDPILADWTASIFDPSGLVFICGSGGNGSYGPRVEPARFDADDWTGDDCSELVPGREYLARAAWSHQMDSGRRDTLSTEFLFVFSRRPT